MKMPATRSILTVACLTGALGLGGCFEGTEVNGKLFDLMGVSTAAQEKSKAEPKMERRSGLVLPPSAARLPEPGTGDEPETITSLQDPDKLKAIAAADRERLHKSYCNGDLSWKERIKDPDAIPHSPYGPCSGVSDALLKRE